MPTEIPHSPYGLPEVSDYTFSNTLLQYEAGRESFHEKIHRDVESMIPGFQHFAHLAIDRSGIGGEREFAANDYLYVMANLLCRQAVTDTLCHEFAASIGAHTSSPIVMPPREQPFDKENPPAIDAIHPFPALVEVAPNVRYFETISILRTKGLVESRPTDAMGHYFSGDYFIDDLFSVERRLVGESALRLYGYMNNVVIEDNGGRA